jgi:ABC-type sugar transport system permease subunit
LFDGRGGYRWGFGNFEKFFNKFAAVGTEENMGLFLRNTIIYFCQDMFIMLPLSLIICYFMYKKIAGYQAFRTIIYLPVIMMAPIMVSLYKFMLDWGIVRVIGEKLGLTLPDTFIMNEDYALKTMLFYILYTGIGGRFVLLGGAMNTIEPSIIDAGKIDGAGPYRELVSIIIPCIWPTLSTLILLSSTGVFTASGPSLLFDKGTCGTMSISYYIYEVVTGGGDNTSVELAAAVGIFFTVLNLPIVMLVKKVTGITEE